MWKIQILSEMSRWQYNIKAIYTDRILNYYVHTFYMILTFLKLNRNNMDENEIIRYIWTLEYV